VERNQKSLLWGRLPVNALGRWLCLLAWLTAVVVQTVFVTINGTKVVIGGIDFTAQNTAILRHGAIFLAIGFLITVASFFWRRWASVLVIASSTLYILHWFPLHSVLSYGPAATFRGMWLVGSIPGLRMTAVTRDIVLPAAFIVTIVLTVRDRLRRKFAATT
jgi:hypothetical protein